MQLVICEKPSQARDIAAAIGATSKHQGYIQGSDTLVTWCFGHLATLAPMDAYDPRLKSWSMDSLPYFPEFDQFKIAATKNGKDQLKCIKDLAKKSEISEIINATDAGREGELIFDLVYRLIQSKKPVKRLWTSSLTKDAIRQAWDQLKSSHAYKGLRDAARSRAEADWIVGLNATRAQTLVEQSKGKQGVYSVGRVQTPTLAMIVERDKKIRNFESKSFETIWANFQTEKGSYKAEWKSKDKAKGSKLFDPEETKKVLEELENKASKIEKVEKKSEKSNAPALYDLTSLQRDCNRKFGLTASHTLEIAQSLYEKHKVLSYPRTNSCFLTGEEGATLFEHIKKGSYESEKILIEKAPNKDLPSRYINPAKVEDHHAIIPTGVQPTQLVSDEAKVYELVTKRSIAAFYNPVETDVVNISTQVGEHTFFVSGKTIVNEGWHQVIQPSQKTKAVTLPEVSPDETVKAKSFESKKGRTEPPKHFTEATLLSAMENAGKEVEEKDFASAMKDTGLGTPATRAATIEQLKSRGYIEVNNKNLLASQRGTELIEGLGSDLLKQATLTGEWEFKLKQIERGKYSRKQFMHEISDFTKQLIQPISLKITKKPHLELGKCFKCSKGSYLLKSYQAKFYAKCSEIDCKSSYPTDKEGKPQKVCKPCGKPLYITKAGSGVCIACNTWENNPKGEQHGSKKTKAISQGRRRTSS